MCSGNEPEIITSIAAVFIAFCALIITFWQGVISRKHNKLSLTPNLNLHLSVFPEDENSIYLFLKNKGVGPAIFKQISINIEDKIYTMQKFDDGCIWKELVKYLQLRNITYTPYYIESGNFIKDGENIQLVLFKSENDKEQLSPIVKSLKHITIIIDYTSVYNDSYQCKLLGNELDTLIQTQK